MVIRVFHIANRPTQVALLTGIILLLKRNREPIGNSRLGRQYELVNKRISYTNRE